MIVNNKVDLHVRLNKLFSELIKISLILHSKHLHDELIELRSYVSRLIDNNDELPPS